MFECEFKWFFARAFEEFGVFFFGVVKVYVKCVVILVVCVKFNVLGV